MPAKETILGNSTKNYTNMGGGAIALFRNGTSLCEHDAI